MCPNFWTKMLTDRDQQVVIGGLLLDTLNFIAAKPEDVELLMSGLIEAYHSLIKDQNLDPIALLTIISFGFVFIHPFVDGNGRIHRFIMHEIIKNTIKPDVIVPISVTILKDISYYRTQLNLYSKNVMQIISFDRINFDVTVKSPYTYGWYAYFDATSLFIYMRRILDQSIALEMKNEINFIKAFDEEVAELLEFVSLVSEETVKEFLNLCISNGGYIPSNHLDKYEYISKDILIRMENIAQSLYKLKC